jgi:poly-beta-hydroxyalkanoate depolymerase
MVGYSIVYLSEETHTISERGKNLIQQADDSQNIVIKVPVAVPYQTNWDAPEQVEGQILHEGRYYQMKSRQLINDTLYVQCEFDQSARERFTDLASKINDQVTGNTPDQQKGQHSTILKNFVKEYMSQDRKHVFYLLEWAPAQHVVVCATQFSLSERYFTIPSPPPDLA